ncbi:hypothetical protein ACOSQ4_012990 [Xanthoceras sorbifolium]
MENCSALLLLAAALMVGVSSKIDDQLGYDYYKYSCSCFMTAKSRVVMHRFCLILKALKWYPPGISVSESEKIKQIKTVLEAERPGQVHTHTWCWSLYKAINIVDRLYDPNSRYQINHSFELLLRLECPPTITPLTNITVVPNDGKPLVFDNHYYTEMLWPGSVHRIALDQNYFFQVFSSAFVRLSSTNVLNEAKGEVRRICNRVNE